MKGFATSFGDKEDKMRYQNAVQEALSSGKSRAEAEAVGRKKGDPGIGWLDNDITDESTPWVALPFEDWKHPFGSKAAAHKKVVLVTIHGVSHFCLLGDTMPKRANITNGAVIDLAPGACKLFGLTVPVKVAVEWRWAGDGDGGRSESSCSEEVKTPEARAVAEVVGQEAFTKFKERLARLKKNLAEMFN